MLQNRRVLFVVLLGATAVWSWLALGVHTLLVIGGECDGYVNRAASLLNGDVVLDGFHPLGLPVLIAAVGLLGVEPFLAGRLVVVATGLLLVACTFLIARTFTTRATAVVAAIAVGASEFVLVGAVQVCSDVPAAAALGILCGYSPHLLRSWYADVPLKNASQLVWKYQRLTDEQLLGYLANPPPFPWADVPRWCVEALGDLLGFLGHGLGGPWSGSAAGWFSAVVSVALTAAMIRGLWRRPPVASMLAIGGWCYVLALCGLTIPESRLRGAGRAPPWPASTDGTARSASRSGRNPRKPPTGN